MGHNYRGQGELSHLKLKISCKQAENDGHHFPWHIFMKFTRENHLVDICRQERKDREKQKRTKGQSSHATWKSEAEMVLRQQYD